MNKMIPHLRGIDSGLRSVTYADQHGYVRLAVPRLLIAVAQMRVLTNVLFAGVLVVASLGCAPPGQRLLRFQIEQGGNQVAEGIRGISDSAEVDEMWDIVEEVPFQLRNEPADAKAGDTMPIAGPVTIRILHVERQLATAELAELSLVRDADGKAWRITPEQSDLLRISANPSR